MPIFVGHEVSKRFKTLLDAVALLMLLGLFFMAMSVAFIRLMRVLR